MSWQHRSLAAALSLGIVFAASFAVRAVQDDSKKKPDASSAETKKESAQGKEAVEAALKKKIDAQLLEMPVHQFAGWIEQECRIQVVIDSRSLTDAGLDPEAMNINLKMRGVTLRSLLQHALRPLDMTPIILEGVLLITTPDKAAASFVTEIYPAIDLVQTQDEGGAVKEDFDPLIEALIAAIPSATWHDDDLGALAGFDGLLVASTTQDRQQIVAGALQALRDAIAAQSRGEMAAQRVRVASIDNSAILAALDSQAEFELLEVPLMQFADIVSQEHRIPVVIDERSLADAGLDPESLTLTADAKSATLRSILERLLSQLDLAFVVDHEALVLTTRDRAASLFETHIYPVGDLVVPADSSKSPTTQAAELVELLTRTVDASQWRSSRGESELQFAAPWNVLVVSTTASTHRNLADALAKLRDAKRRQAENNLVPGEKTTSDDPMELRVFGIAGITNGDGEIAGQVAVLVRELSPELSEKVFAGGADSYLRALPDRIVVRHRRSVLAKVAALLKQLESPQDQGATTASARPR